jgi:hypothetical protein
MQTYNFTTRTKNSLYGMIMNGSAVIALLKVLKQMAVYNES